MQKLQPLKSTKEAAGLVMLEYGKALTAWPEDATLTRSDPVRLATIWSPMQELQSIRCERIDLHPIRWRSRS